MLLELAAFVVAVTGLGLVSSAPGRPGQQGGDGVVGGEEHGVEEAAEFVDAQLDQPRRRGLVVAFDGGGHGEEGVGEHGQGGPAVPGGSASDLVLRSREGLLPPVELPAHQLTRPVPAPSGVRTESNEGRRYMPRNATSGQQSTWCCRNPQQAGPVAHSIVSDRPQKLSDPIGSVLVDVVGRSVTTHGH